MLVSARRVLSALFLGLILFLRPGAAEASKLILILGDDSYIPPEAVEAWTGAEVKKELGSRSLLEFVVVILSNIRYGVLPQAVREALPEFVKLGGSLLITGGPNSYGSGGYLGVAYVIPFQIRAGRDWRAGSVKPVFPLRDHPILGGVTFRPLRAFNDLNRKPGALEIARYGGGGSPLVAEQRIGRGTVLGVAFDLGREIRTGWTYGTRFVHNILVYLAERSPLMPKSK